MTDREDNYFQQEANVVQHEAKSWFSSLHWMLKLGIPLGVIAIGGLSFLSFVSSVADKATAPPRDLNATQMKIVNDAAKAAFSSFTEDNNGKTLKGELVSCSSTDTDAKGTQGYGKVTCKGRIPSVVSGTNGPVVRMIEKDLQCTIPTKDVSGCKDGK